MNFKLGARSKDRLKGIHPDLVKIVELAITLTEVDFTVLEGLRSQERQDKLVDKGASQTRNSRHLTGHAVDLGAWVDGEVRWDWPLYYKLAKAMKDAAKQLDITLEWGGDWRSFKDGPHFQLTGGHIQTDDTWRYRRRFMITIIVFCMVTIGYILLQNLDSESAQTAVSMAFVILGTTVSSYVFGATWQDINLKGTK